MEMDVQYLLQQLVNGLSNGMIIALIAIGYTMVYGIIELINWAHGDLCMLGAFFALTLIGALGIAAWTGAMGPVGLVLLLVASALFCGSLNVFVDYAAYRPLRKAPKLTLLVTAIGVSFVFVNLGLFWGGMPVAVVTIFLTLLALGGVTAMLASRGVSKPLRVVAGLLIAATGLTIASFWGGTDLEVFGGSDAAAAPKKFPTLVSTEPLVDFTAGRVTIGAIEWALITLGAISALATLVLPLVIQRGANDSAAVAARTRARRVLFGVSALSFIALLFALVFHSDGGADVVVTIRDVVIVGVTLPLMAALWWLVRFTKLGKAMRAVAQNPIAASLMGINTDRVISACFFIGGALGGFGSVIYAINNGTISFQLGYRAGMDAFTAAVLGGIGSLPGAVLGGILIGVARSMSDAYLEARWTPTLVFAILILILIFRPSGLLGLKTKEKV